MPVAVGSEYRQAGSYLRFAAARRRAHHHPSVASAVFSASPVVPKYPVSSVYPTPPVSNQVKGFWVQLPSMTITPVISLITTDAGSHDTIVNLTVPSFTFPIRVRPRSAREDEAAQT